MRRNFRFIYSIEEKVLPLFMKCKDLIETGGNSFNTFFWKGLAAQREHFVGFLNI